MSGRFGFVLRRLILAVPLLLGIVLLVFLLLQITPGDPARLVAGLRATPEQVELVRQDMGLDRSVLVQYFDYLGNVVRGDLGYSVKSRVPVSELILSRLPASVWLITAGGLVALIISIPFGIWAAIKRDKAPDHIVRGASLLAITMPPFWVGIMLIILIALPTGFFPVGGFGDTFAERLRAITLPALTLGIALSPILIRGLRSSTIKVLESDYVQMGRSLGASGWTLVRKFVLRTTLSSVVTLLAIESSILLFSMVVLETTFRLPGLGQGMVAAAAQRDFSAVQGFTLVFAVTVVAIYLAADVVNTMLDPRVEIKG